MLWPGRVAETRHFEAKGVVQSISAQGQRNGPVRGINSRPNPVEQIPDMTDLVCARRGRESQFWRDVRAAEGTRLEIA